MADTLFFLIPFGLLLFFSAFFSGSETALFSLSIFELEKLMKTVKSRTLRFLKIASSRADDVLITILTGNMLVNMFATTLYERFIQDKVNFENDILALLFPTISMTLILLFCGELFPKNLAVRNPVFFARLNSVPLHFIYRVLSPLRVVLAGIKRLFTIRIPAESQERDIIDATLQIGHKEGIINQLELSLFESFFDFNILTAEEVMLPRTRIQMTDKNERIADLLLDLEQEHRRSMHSLLLVCDASIDHPVGYIELKDLLPFKAGLVDDAPAGSIVRPLHQVPESKKLNQLMREMKEMDTQMTVVVDEYGGTSGVIAFNNLVETILANLYTAQRELVREIGTNAFLLPGSVEVRILEEVLGKTFETDSRTVGGMIIERLGEIPAAGVSVTIQSCAFTVLKMYRNRIATLKAEVVS